MGVSAIGLAGGDLWLWHPWDQPQIIDQEGPAALGLAGIGEDQDSSGEVGNRHPAVVGLVLMWKISRVDYRLWRAMAFPVFCMLLVLLVLVLIPHVGIARLGRRTSLRVSPWVEIQPSALAGLAIVLFLAWWYEAGDLRPASRFWVPFMALGLLAGVILAEPDVTPALLVVLSGMAMTIIGGERVRYVAISSIWVVAGLTWLILRDPERMAHVLALFTEDPPAPACIPVRSLALAAGGWSGVGIGNGEYSRYFLPDAGGGMISAVIGEELGRCGLLAMNALHIAMVVAGAYIVVKVPNRFATLLGSGIVAQLGIQVLLNMLVLTTSFPLRPPPLPFVSYGGLNLCVSLTGVGVLLNMARKSVANLQSARTANGSISAS